MQHEQVWPADGVRDGDVDMDTGRVERIRQVAFYPWYSSLR
jgi:hypothetical protein